jgi:hypothetical protein
MIELENIKDNSYIVDGKLNDSGGYDIILKNGTWLGDVLEFLPNGIINKGITGIGATTLELNCDRNSIIIQPLKITVEEKSLGNYKHEIFSYNKKKSSSLSKALTGYLNDSSIKFKKIILVIDRLEDLIYILGDRVVDFFLLFDEIDYMQGSSTYRNKMEIGIDLGKALDNFALVSATHIGFSDPELKKLKTYNFSYEEPEFNKVQTYYLSTTKLEKEKKDKATLNQMYSCICHMLTNTQSKLMVAVNNVKLIKELSETLIKANIVSSTDITLLISDSNLENSKLIQKYSSIPITNKQLPTRLNFITSAYFNGYDLEEEDLCLIIYSSPNYKTNLITVNEIKQIYGRNRIKDGITSFFVFTHDIKENDLNDVELIDSSERDWIERGESCVEMQNCIDNHLHKLNVLNKKNDYFSRFFKKQTEAIEFNLSRTKKIFDKDNFIEVFFNPLKTSKENVIAYLQIDYLRYYYNYLKEMYVMSELEIEEFREIDFEINGEIASAIYFVSVGERFREAMLASGFEEVVNKTEWQNLEFKPEKSTHESEIAEALEQVLKVIKESPSENHNFSALQQKIFKILTVSKKYYSAKSTQETILKCNSKSTLDILYEFVKEGDFKKTSKYLIIKGKLKVNKSYSIQELIDVASEATDNTTKNNKMSSAGALKLVRLVYNTKTVNKRGGKKGEKLYVLEKIKPFSTLKKTPKQSNRK